ncbi:PREDICTED: glucan endo-1,3-beta-glucosidase, acidic-like [Ipomoea nil]|uniref:glucan endo-1,3-beta-glucosidase, acidic-like n=1 Tax=Ipomoea nil TaxID=35883 RepID=UPI0009008CFC|nr:PREDICTED: glucan endo-1,3-beta-glucosidase, acidic-like [Ipomoea nil]
MALQHPLPCKSSMAALILLLVGLLHITEVESIGVCYGKNGNNLPSETDTINLMKSNGIRGLRVYAADPPVFNAARGSNLAVIVDVSNPKLQELTDPARAKAWVQANIVPYANAVNFKYIAVGNEVFAGNPDTARYVNFVMPALRNVHNALAAAGLQGKIKATTATYSAVLTNTYPPNQGVFRDDAKGLMNPVVQFLAQTGNPLLANIYPYFSYRGNPSQIPLSYALFTERNPNPAGYRNLFDALLDSMYAAVQKAGGPNVPIVVSETGWPSAGGFAATTQNAATYYRNLISHVKGNAGTPLKPGRSIETYLFAMYDENLKGGDAVEKNFGVFRPDKSSKYQLNFN